VTDLRFTQPRQSVSAANLALDFRPAPTATLPPRTGALFGVLGPPTANLRGAVELRVSRPTVAHTGGLWREALTTAQHSTATWRASAGLRLQVADYWQAAVQATQTIACDLASLQSTRAPASITWNAANAISHAASSPFASLLPKPQRYEFTFDQALAINATATIRFVQLVPTRQWESLPFAVAGSVTQLSLHPHATARPTRTERTLPWDRAGAPRFGRSSLPVEPTTGGGPNGRVHPTLNFCCPADQIDQRWTPNLRLRFTKKPCVRVGLIIPTLKVYLVTHEIAVVRLPGREPIPTKSINLSIDADSWAWGFTASIPLRALELVEPTAAGPVEIEITVNGIRWIMLVEGFDLRREFGASEANLRGRSLAAYLAEPYAPKRSFTQASPFTARQLAEQELERATLATGFDLDWQLPDWLVPAGAWSYESLTPMQVITRIVESVGGSLNAHTQLKRMVAQSRYLSLPWEWDSQTPHRTLPIDVVKTLSARWSEKPEFNAVYVGGEREGIIARVRRFGTAGDQLAPMVIDPLITHTDAARERGRAVLADSGRQAIVTLELPMLPSIGLLEPGRLIAVGENGNSWRGLVRGTNVSANWSQSLVVRQIVDVERRRL